MTTTLRQFDAGLAELHDQIRVARIRYEQTSLKSSTGAVAVAELEQRRSELAQLEIRQRDLEAARAAARSIDRDNEEEDRAILRRSTFDAVSDALHETVEIATEIERATDHLAQLYTRMHATQSQIHGMIRRSRIVSNAHDLTRLDAIYSKDPVVRVQAIEAMLGAKNYHGLGAAAMQRAEHVRSDLRKMLSLADDE